MLRVSTDCAWRPLALNLNGASSPFEGEADDEAACAQLIKSLAKRGIVLDQHVAHPKLCLELYGKLEEREEEICPCTKVKARIVLGKFKDVTVL